MTKIGSLSFHHTEGAPWVLSIKEGFFDSSGWLLPKINTEFLTKNGEKTTFSESKI